MNSISALPILLALIAGAWSSDKLIDRIIIGEQAFKLEVAADAPSRAKGLMNRETIDRDGGMIFIYPEPEVLTFWMHSCLIDLDLIYLDDRGRIITLHKMKAEPLQGENEPDWRYQGRLKQYSSRKSAQFAIELQHGSIDRLELKVGQTIQLDLKRLKSLAK